MFKTPFMLLQIQLAPAKSPKFIIICKYPQSRHFDATQCQEDLKKNFFLKICYDMQPLSTYNRATKQLN